MPQTFKTVAVFGKIGTPGLREPLGAIARIVESCGQTVMFEAATRETAGLGDYTGHSIAAIGKHADVAIVLGGDGTMLGIARELAAFRIPLIGINHGRLGFMTDITIEQMPEVLTAMLAGQFQSDRRSLLDAEVRRAGVTLMRARALNDVVVARGVTGGMVEFTVRVDGVAMYTQRADGVILATPTGSTAYALSANGPILHPSLSGLVLVPVAPHSLTHRPIVLPDNSLIEIEVTDVRDGSAHFDMQTNSPLLPGDVVRVKLSSDVVTFLNPVGTNYYATLRQKLHWSVMLTEPNSRK